MSYGFVAPGSGRRTARGHARQPEHLHRRHERHLELLHSGRRRQHRSQFQPVRSIPVRGRAQEFKVQSGIYPAEFGREAGQINVSTKSGGNHFSRNRLRVPAQRRARRQGLRLRRHDAAEESLPPESVRLHAGRAGLDSKAVQREEQAVFHVELRGLQVTENRERALYRSDRTRGGMAIFPAFCRNPTLRSLQPSYGKWRHNRAAVSEQSDSARAVSIRPR